MKDGFIVVSTFLDIDDHGGPRKINDEAIRYDQVKKVWIDHTGHYITIVTYDNRKYQITTSGRAQSTTMLWQIVKFANSSFWYLDYTRSIQTENELRDIPFEDSCLSEDGDLRT